LESATRTILDASINGVSVRVGIVGLGGVAHRIHLPACRLVDEIEVVGGCDPSSEARAAASNLGVPRTFATCRELLENTSPAIVIVGTPPSSHFEICQEAFESGAHVFCEKPFMPNVDQADRIIEMARARNLLLRVNNQYRFMSFYRDTKERLDQGEFGRCFYIQAWQQMFHPPTCESNWRSQLTQYVLYEFGTHALDLASFFFDALPVSLNAHIPRARPEFDSDVLVHAALRFPEERLAVFSFNRISHAPEKYLEMRLDCELASLRISLGGVARISVEWSRAARRPVLKAGLLKGGQARAEVKGVSHTYSSSRQGEFATATGAHLRHFLEEMRKPQRSLEGATHAREILNLVFAGYESARSGETVHLQPLAASIH
jgi:scyllo-inositol 2-dehydrogenase (NADP+)